ILLPNIDRELFSQIFEMHEAAGARVFPEVSEILQKGALLLSGKAEFGFENVEACFSFARAKLKERLDSNRKNLPYSYSNVKKIIQQNKISSPLPSLQDRLSILVQRHSTKFALGAIATVLFLFLLFPPTKEEKPVMEDSPFSAPTFKPKQGIPGAFGEGQEREVKGIVREILVDGIEIRVPLPVARLLIKWTGKADAYKVGKIFRGRIRLTGYKNERWLGEIIRKY
ncbi:hypothetical protein HYY75_06130, partial [bacterium]|nr:hypothetical protein [bacterium]